MSKYREDLENLIIELVDNTVDPMERKIHRLQNTINRCRDVMTAKQKCVLFQEQNCHECKDYDCGDNLNKSNRKIDIEFLKTLREALDEKDSNVINAFAQWFIGMIADDLAEQLYPVVNVFQMVKKMTELINVFTKIQYEYKEKVADQEMRSRHEINAAYDVINAAKIDIDPNDDLADCVQKLWKRSVDETLAKQDWTVVDKEKTKIHQEVLEQTLVRQSDVDLDSQECSHDKDCHCKK